MLMTKAMNLTHLHILLVPYICPKVWGQTNHIMPLLANFYYTYKYISEGLVRK